jgi:major vault protein
MVEENRRQERELVLAPNEYAQISDETKGDITTYVGPNTTSLAATARPVVLNYKTKRFERVELNSAIQTQVIAPEGWYVTLKNPTVNDDHPAPGSRASTPPLSTGRKVNIPGPVGFALWPGQIAKVLQGHHIRSNQYLLVRVYDERAATDNWEKAVLKVAKPIVDNADLSEEQKKQAEQEAHRRLERVDLQMGTLLVIRGTDVSFFIPPTGLEVVADDNKNLVRDAVTLERLEYCLLLDQNGNKRYVQGPDVVFPKPTEVFVTRMVPDRTTGENKPTRKMRAIELSETSGLYIKVIADYEENGVEYKTGQELFITGKDQMIYFPREEHSLVKYGEQEVHYAIAIPAGEARYVLDRQFGGVSLVKGPAMFLPDPRRQVIVRRILDLKLCQLLYPGNLEAYAYNQGLLGIEEEPVEAAMRGGGHDLLRGRVGAAPAAAHLLYANASLGDSATARGLNQRAARGFTGDTIDRKNQFTEPRSITLRTKYDGALTASIWTGYAMLLVSKSGERRIVQGPQTVLMEYDEEPQVLELSTGKPKTTDKLEKTVFLRVHANKVGDIIDAQTKDFCQFKIKLSYRVHFEGDSKKWFDVENYVKFLCDNMRSRVKNEVLKYTAQEFFAQGTEILRDLILGPSSEDGTPRKGTFFAENGMRIYDVEVLLNELQDVAVRDLLVAAQREAIRQNLLLENQDRTLTFTKRSETIQQLTLEAKAETTFHQAELSLKTIAKQLEVDIETSHVDGKLALEKQSNALSEQKARALVESERLLLAKTSREQEIALSTKEMEQRLIERRAEVEALIEKAKAITPGFVEALNAFGERAMIEKVSSAMAPLSILGGTSVMDVVKKLLEGTNLGQHLASTATNGNGKGEHRSASPTA